MCTCAGSVSIFYFVFKCLSFEHSIYDLGENYLEAGWGGDREDMKQPI